MPVLTPQPVPDPAQRMERIAELVNMLGQLCDVGVDPLDRLTHLLHLTIKGGGPPFDRHERLKQLRQNTHRLGDYADVAIDRTDSPSQAAKRGGSNATDHRDHAALGATSRLNASFLHAGRVFQ